MKIKSRKLWPLSFSTYLDFISSHYLLQFNLFSQFFISELKKICKIKLETTGRETTVWPHKLCATTSTWSFLHNTGAGNCQFWLILIFYWLFWVIFVNSLYTRVITIIAYMQALFSLLELVLLFLSFVGFVSAVFCSLQVWLAASQKTNCYLCILEKLRITFLTKIHEIYSRSDRGWNNSNLIGILYNYKF